MSWKRSRDESRVRALLHSVHQSTPERESFGAIRGTGFFLMRKADAVFVCQAIISMVLEVTFMVLGLVCWRSLKRALLPTWNLTIPKMNASIASLAIWPFRRGSAPPAAAPCSKARMTSLAGTTALRCGVDAVETKVSWSHFFFDASRWVAVTSKVWNLVLNHFRVSQACWM